MRPMAMVGAVLVLAGCSGVEIRPIAREDAESAHSARSIAAGYIVYAPVVVVEIAQRRLCVRKDSKGNCEEEEVRCAAGTPFVLPDRSKPYLINFRSGFGKAGAGVSIADGWRLSGIKDTADNQSVLGFLGKLPGLAGVRVPDSVAGGGDCPPGLYRVDADEQGVRFLRVPGS